MENENKTREQVIVELSQLRKNMIELDRLNINLAGQLSSILNNANGIIYTLSTEGYFIYVSRGWTETLGHQVDEVVGHSFEDFVYSDDIPVCRDALVKIMNSGVSVPAVDYRVRHRDGTWRWHTSSCGSVKDEQGHPQYAVGMATDITRRKIAEEALFENEEKYRHLFELESDAIVLVDNEFGQILDVNAAAIQLYGYSRDEWVAMKNTDVSAEPGDTRHATVEQLEVVPVRWHRKKDGTLFPIEITASHFLWKGRPVHLAAIRDITWRVQAEAALRRSEEKFSKAFRFSPDPISISTYGEGRYVDVNDNWLLTFGYERKEVIGQTVMGLGRWIVPDERSQMYKMLQKNENVRNQEVQFRNKKGETGTFLLSVEIVDIDGRPHLLSISKDITQHKTMVEELRLSEERFSKAFNASPNAMVISVLEDGVLIAVNESCCHMVGYEYEEIKGRTSVETGFWLSQEARANVVDKLVKDGSFRDLEVQFGRKSGEIRVGLYSAETLEINSQQCILSIITDITERKQAAEQIEYLSFNDKLTGLHNRTYLELQIQRIEAEKLVPVSLIISDVNGLKLINDAMGRQEGDGLLMVVAQILKNLCRPQDIAGRWGGDEFILLLPGCDHDEASRVAEQMKAVFRIIDNLPTQVSVSLGLATRTDPKQDMREVIKEAEDKMYRNKVLESLSTRSAFLTSLEKTLWTRSYETREHCQRIQDMAAKIGGLVHLPNSEMDNLQLLAALHDIGKIAIPNNILDKPAALTDEEWETIKKHPEIGYRIALSSPEMAPIAEAILHHHERWDGTGYPLGFKGAQIPLISRIIAIADAYDVMVHGRPYRKAVSQADAWDEIRRCAGSQFDPEIVTILLEQVAWLSDE